MSKMTEARRQDRNSRRSKRARLKIKLLQFGSELANKPTEKQTRAWRKRWIEWLFKPITYEPQPPRLWMIQQLTPRELSARSLAMKHWRSIDRWPQD